MTQAAPLTIGRAGVGNEIRQAREQLGWTLPAMAAHLRIRLPYLEAIEEGRFGDLPGNAYAVGFLRTYARALGLDSDEIARRFKAEAADVNRKTELSFPAPVPERGVPAGAAVLLGVMLVVVAYIGWYRFSGERRPEVESVPAVPERMATMIPTPTTERPASQTATPAPSTIPLVGASPQSATPKLPAPPAVVASNTAPASPPQTAATSPVSVGVSVGASVAALAPPAATTPAPDGGRLVLRAKSEAWMQVRDASGTIVLNRTLRAGETWPVPNRPGLLLTVGNAGGTELLLDGAATAPLGAEGTVRRDLSLDLAQVRDGKLAPTQAAPLPKPAAAPPAAPKQP